MGVKRINEASDTLLKPQQIMDRLGIKERKFRDMVATGELSPIVRIGRMIRMKPEALDSWINKREGK